MMKLTLLSAALLAFGDSAVNALSSCGQSQYDPAQYVCWSDQFLCPITAGEPLSFCNGACYSKFMYKCENNVLSLLPAHTGTPFTLSVSNPTLPIDGKPVSASGLHLSLAGNTSTYCPVEVVGAACPPGNITAFFAGNGGLSMDTMVPGGQQAYLGPDWNMHYTQAHSAYIPAGSLTQGFGAYEGGGFVNLNGNGWGWVACPPQASGGGGTAWNLVGRNETNAASLTACTPVNLKINPLPSGTVGAWQYA